MASVSYLDTHVVLWLYEGTAGLLPKGVREQLERDRLVVSPAVTLELQFLYEIDRVTEPAKHVLDALARSVGLSVCDLPFEHVVHEAVGQTWTRDPFDRLIVGQAAVRLAPLITKDRTIRKHYPHALWRR